MGYKEPFFGAVGQGSTSQLLNKPVLLPCEDQTQNSEGPLLQEGIERRGL